MVLCTLGCSKSIYVYAELHNEKLADKQLQTCAGGKSGKWCANRQLWQTKLEMERKIGEGERYLLWRGIQQDTGFSVWPQCARSYVEIFIILMEKTTQQIAFEGKREENSLSDLRGLIFTVGEAVRLTCGKWDEDEEEDHFLQTRVMDVNFGKLTPWYLFSVAPGIPRQLMIILGNITI